MAFRLGDIVIDRIQYAVAENYKGLLYVLTQLSEATINTTAESVDAVDGRGTLVKRFYRGKSCEFTATNALVNMDIIGASSGSDPIYASTGAKITMPKIIAVNAGQTGITLTGYVEGSVYVYALDDAGTLGAGFTKGDAANESTYALDGSGNLSLPTASGVTRYLVKYLRQEESAMAVINSADKFPGTVELTLKVLAVDPCHPDMLRAGYVVFPSFQVSPEVDITLQTEGNLDYSGQAQVDYCSAQKELYGFYWAEDDIED